MLFTNPDISKLPTITETVQLLREMTEGLPKVQGFPFETDCQLPYILTKTTSMFSIKPNILHNSCLFMGRFSLTDPLRGLWWQNAKPNFMIKNVLQEEMRIVMESHPMYRLFQDGFMGIHIINPYGIEMAYGQETAMLPLSSDIETAAFFASHKIDLVSGTSEPCSDGWGILYVFELRAPMPYIPGLSTVGKQPFERSGRAKLFGYDTTNSSNFNALPFVKGFAFRHDLNSSKEIGQIFSNDKSLLPQELFAHKIRNILTGNRVSWEAIERNLMANPRDSKGINAQIIRSHGYEIVESLDLSFTREELKPIWYDNVENRWTEFWSDVSFHNLRSGISEEIMNLPNNSKYSRYFI